MSTVSASAPLPGASPVSIPLFRLYLLRAGYLLLVVGVGLTVWPAVMTRVAWAPSLCGWTGIGDSLLAGLALVSVLGLRYPLKMLPLLLFEMAWKAIWLLSVALPTLLAHAPIILWRYVAATSMVAAGDRWR